LSNAASNAHKAIEQAILIKTPSHEAIKQQRSRAMLSLKQRTGSAMHLNTLYSIAFVIELAANSKAAINKRPIQSNEMQA